MANLHRSPDTESHHHRVAESPRVTLSEPWYKLELAKAFRYTITRREALTRFVTDGRLEADNNVAENAMRTIALGRKNYLFAGSDAGGERAAAISTLIQTAKMNGLNPETYLCDALARIADGHTINRIGELVPWKMSQDATSAQ